MVFELFYNIFKAIKKQIVLLYHGFCNSELDKVTTPKIKYILLFVGLMIVTFVTMTKIKYITEKIAFEMVKAIVLVTTSDILQYVFGKMYGNTIFSNKTMWFSPNKTYEGYLFGCFVAILGGILLEFNLLTSTIFVISGVLGGIISSAAKRSLQIKDWSNLLLSHGGFIDRCDGYIIPLTMILLME
ncbi:MAG: phosphatidate cytidylyltransferase [Terrestrivirus sp.]|uniref:Phosphatidate cytidylyltransferase n=1 Tax=Terrestrivirus sp. TaxID=2487775 RepID=A0A3G4ZN27_9VIRU|nr:MAG: phosphatidate cytidylyltransferase [Terrestrivirus sp.]